MYRVGSDLQQYVIPKPNTINSNSTIYGRIESLVKQRLFDESIEEYKKMATGTKPENQHQIVFLDDFGPITEARKLIIDGLVDLGEVNRALELPAPEIDLDVNKKTEVSVRSEVCHSLIRKGDYAQATTIAKQGVTNHCLSTLSKSLVRIGKYQEAQEAIELANKIDNYFVKNKALYSISVYITDLIGKESTDRVLNIVNKIDNIESIFGSHRSPLPIALLRISYKLSLMGDIDKAIEVASTIPHDIVKSYALIKICLLLIENQDVDKAIEVSNAIPIEYYYNLFHSHPSIGDARDPNHSLKFIWIGSDLETVIRGMAREITSSL